MIFGFALAGMIMPALVSLTETRGWRKRSEKWELSMRIIVNSTIMIWVLLLAQAKSIFGPSVRFDSKANNNNYGGG